MYNTPPPISLRFLDLPAEIRDMIYVLGGLWREANSSLQHDPQVRQPTTVYILGRYFIPLQLLRR